MAIVVRLGRCAFERHSTKTHRPVIPAQAGTQVVWRRFWIAQAPDFFAGSLLIWVPACARMTVEER